MNRNSNLRMPFPRGGALALAAAFLLVACKDGASDAPVTAAPSPVSSTAAVPVAPASAVPEPTAQAARPGHPTRLEKAAAGSRP